MPGTGTGPWLTSLASQYGSMSAERCALHLHAWRMSHRSTTQACAVCLLQDNDTRFGQPYLQDIAWMDHDRPYMRDEWEEKGAKCAGAVCFAVSLQVLEPSFT